MGQNFVKAVRYEVNKTYYRVTRSIFCYIHPKREATVTPLSIWFPLETGTQSNGSAVTIKDAMSERFRLELDSRVGTLFKRYVKLQGGDVRKIPKHIVQFTTHPFGLLIPNPDPPRVLYWSPSVGGDVDRLPLGYAYDEDGERLFCWRINDDPHGLICGITGSGKSEAIRTLVVGLIENTSPTDVEIVLIDKKRRSLVDLETAPHVRLPLAYKVETALGYLRAAVAEMDRRVEQGGNRPVLFLVIDEIADLLNGDAQAQDWLTRIAQMGRELGIVIVAGTQKALIGNIGPMKSQLGFRAVGKMASNREALAVAETDVNSASFLHPGSFSVVSAGGQSTDVLAFYADGDAIAATIERAAGRWGDPLPSALAVDGFGDADNGKDVDKTADLAAQAEEDFQRLYDQFGDGLAKTSMRKCLGFLGLATKGEKYYADKERVLRAKERLKHLETV